MVRGGFHVFRGLVAPHAKQTRWGLTRAGNRAMVETWEARMETWLGTAAVVAVIVIGLLLVIQLVIMSVLILAITRLVQEARERMDPLVTKVDHLLAVVGATAEHAQGKANTAIDATSKATTTVAGGVEKTGRLAQRVVAWPIVAVLAASDGLKTGYQTWRDARRRRHDEGEPKAL